MVKSYSCIFGGCQSLLWKLSTGNTLLPIAKIGKRLQWSQFVQFEGMLTGKEEKVVVVAATNRPQELDDAALRRCWDAWRSTQLFLIRSVFFQSLNLSRFTKRIYVEMPDKAGRRALVNHLLSQHGEHRFNQFFSITYLLSMECSGKWPFEVFI